MREEKNTDFLTNTLPAANSDAADYDNTPRLDDWAIEDLRRSGLSDDTIKRMGCYSVRSDEEIKSLVGFGHMNGKSILEQAEAAYAIPYNDSSTFCRIRVKKPIPQPNGKSAKYLSPKKSVASPWHVYYFHGEDAKFSKKKGAIIIVEGEKKAAKVAQDLVAAGDMESLVIGTPGITIWEQWKEWNGQLRIGGRPVYIAFDAADFGSYNDSNFEDNISENIDVEHQAMKLWLFLRTQKKVRNAYIIDWDHKEKGIDDYLVANPNSIKTLVDTASPNPFECLPMFRATNGYEHLAPIVVSLFLKKIQYKAIWEELQLENRFFVGFETFNKLIASLIKKAEKKDNAETLVENKTQPMTDSIIWISPKGKVMPAAAAVAFAKKNESLVYHQDTESFWNKTKTGWAQILDEQVFCYLTAFIGKELATTTIINDIMHFLKALFVENKQPADIDTSNCLINGQGRVLPKFAALSFLKQQQGNLIYINSKFWLYGQPKAGIWQHISDTQLLCRISNMLEAKKVTLSLLSDILENVRYILMEEQSKNPISFDTQTHLLCFTNLVFDTKAMKLMPHARDLYQTIQFPYAHPGIIKMSKQDLRAASPCWHKFLDSLKFIPLTIQRLQEWFGLSLVPITKLERCLFLKGKGSNGKSTMLEVLTNLVGRSQVSHIPPAKLFEPFQLCGIEGKLINISGDIATTVVFDEQFKDVITGTEQTTQAKYKDPFTFKPYARFIFSANNYIPSRDHSEGFYRRFDVIEFTQKFSKETKNIDRELAQKLLSELPYILIWAIEGLDRIQTNNWEFTDSQEFAKAKAEFERNSDPVREFIETNFFVSKDPNDSIETKTLRAYYTDWCKETHHTPMAENRLGQEILNFALTKKRVRDKVSGLLECHYTGIRLPRPTDSIPGEEIPIPIPEPIVKPIEDYLSPEEEESLKERIAILEVECNLTHEQAQVQARKSVLALRKQVS